jgi:hypothetical protein
MVAHELLASSVLQVDHLVSPVLSGEWAKAIDTTRDPSRCMRSIVFMG